MKHLHSFDTFISEGLSKINPGKRLIQSGLAGAPSASKYLAAAKKALETWVKMAEEISKARAAKDKAKLQELVNKKKEILTKLMELKKETQEKVAAEIKDVPKEKQVKAKEKAEAVSKQFTDAIKKREQKAAKIEGSEVEGGAGDAEKIKSEMEKIKSEMKSKEDAFYDDFDKSSREEEEALTKKMEDKGFSYADMVGDNGQNEASDEYEEFLSKKSAKEQDFYKSLQALADKYTELEKQANAEGEKNESIIWESIDRILEFDAQAMVDKAKERAEKTAAKIEDIEAKKDDSEGDEEEVQDDDAIEAEIEKLESEWEKKKDELLAGMEQAEKDGDDGPGGKKDKLQSQYAEAEEEFNTKKEELEDKLSTPESVNYGMKNYQTFEQFVNERFNPVNEGKVIYKRGYTNNYPARFANEKAAVRNVVIGSIKDSVITEEEFQRILSETGAHGRWSSRNSHLFNVTKEGVKLSSYGLKIWERVKGGTMISEGNAFLLALKEAREKGEKTFEFNGKTFTVKASKLNEDN